MLSKGIIAAAVAITLSATPALGAARDAGAAQAQLAPATESVDGLQLDGGSGSIIVIILALVAVGLGIWAIADGGDDTPASP